MFQNAHCIRITCKRLTSPNIPFQKLFIQRGQIFLCYSDLKFFLYFSRKITFKTSIILFKYSLKSGNGTPGLYKKIECGPYFLYNFSVSMIFIFLLVNLLVPNVVAGLLYRFVGFLFLESIILLSRSTVFPALS